MGVAGLWDILKPAAQARSLTELAVTEGFNANPDGVRGFRVGIDASIWFFHAEYGREGENPELRTMFFRCATLMHAPFLPVFVFDGPRRPEVKRGKKISRTSHSLIPGMKSIVEAFGFEWRTAPAEAEAELAYMNRIGAIDGILSDDVDTFLFGATVVIRNSSNNLSGNRSNPVLNADGRDDKNHSRVFRLDDIINHPDIGLTRGGLILIGLLSGGDYEQGGVSGCGPTIAHGLARCGFGDSLYEATQEMSRHELKDFLVAWRYDLCQELRTNSRGFIGRKHSAVANKIPPNFPNIDILLSYTNPITSETEGRPVKKSDLTWSKEPNIGNLAATCEQYFEWGYREAIIKRFRTVIWHGAVLRILRRAVLDLDQKNGSSLAIPATPRKLGKNGPWPFGTPSKLITKHFSSLALHEVDSDDDDEERLIVKIHSQREHASTDKILEYRLEVAPAQLVRIAESGLRDLRQPIGPDEWAEMDDDEDGGKKGKKEPPEPSSHLRVWMPACMVRIAEPHVVEDYEEVVRKKEEKKANKGQGKGRGKTKKAPTAEGPDSSSDKEDTPRKRAVRAATTKPPAKAPSIMSLEDSGGSETEAQAKPLIRDLTKKKTPAGGDGIKSFYKTSKTITNAGKKPAQTSGADKATTKPPSIPDSPFSVDYPDFLAPSGSFPAIRDLTKKATGSKRVASFSQTTTSKASTSKGLSASSSVLQRIEEGLDVFSSRTTSSSSSKATTSKDTLRTPMPPETDSFLYDSDDEPANNGTMPSPPRKHVREPTITPSTSEESFGAHIHKSPKKSPKHTSPRRAIVKRSQDHVESRVRSTSPTPEHAFHKPQPIRAKKTPIASSNFAIEISDSDSDSDDPPPPRAAFAPLLLARARARQATSQPNEIPKNRSAVCQRLLPRKLAKAPSPDIIDLT